MESGEVGAPTLGIPRNRRTLSTRMSVGGRFRNLSQAAARLMVEYSRTEISKLITEGAGMRDDSWLFTRAPQKIAARLAAHFLRYRAKPLP